MHSFINLCNFTRAFPLKAEFFFVMYICPLWAVFQKPATLKQVRNETFSTFILTHIKIKFIFPYGYDRPF